MQPHFSPFYHLSLQLWCLTMNETSINATHKSIQTADDEKCGAACSDSQEGLFLDSNSARETVMEGKISAKYRLCLYAWKLSCLGRVDGFAGDECNVT